jgi:hypothetical protein
MGIYGQPRLSTSLSLRRGSRLWKGTAVSHTRDLSITDQFQQPWTSPGHSHLSHWTSHAEGRSNCGIICSMNTHARPGNALAGCVCGWNCICTWDYAAETNWLCTSSRNAKYALVHNKEAYWEIGDKLHSFWISAVGGSEWSASHPCLFIPRKMVRCQLGGIQSSFWKLLRR